MKKSILTFLMLTLSALTLSTFTLTVNANETSKEVSQILFKNVNVFDGINENLQNNVNVLVKDVAIVADFENKIKVIVKDGDFYKNTL